MTHADRDSEPSVKRKPGFDIRSARSELAVRVRLHRPIVAPSASTAAVGDAERDEIARYFAQQMLRERAGAALGEAKQFDEILGSDTHVGLLHRGANRAPPQSMKIFLL
ncbi:hypothetical protein QZM22_00970 [Burkholderia oklahomensis]|uniref:hypothetical protein n=1 Tax=Burkholderia oklahomensis TaxID=342113 RepID=UPI00264B0743|nr:hypothetical protein [Burkholderia oklahomensis]MDN7671124.1 hypothetical protein [Burkholderia oklahomensis]